MFAGVLFLTVLFLKVLFVTVGLSSTVQMTAAEVTLADYQKLRINEILSANQTTFPRNCRCNFRDMVEIYNGSDKTLPLDTTTNGVLRLWDRSFLQICTTPSDCMFFSNSFRLTGQIAPGQRMVIFCDSSPNCEDRKGQCPTERADIPAALEMHTQFGLDGQGECLLLTLDPDRSLSTDDEIVLHEVTFPALRDDVSYSRFPEDVENTDTFVFTRRPTFGKCHSAPPQGAAGWVCEGDPNNGADLIPPDIESIDYSTNNPEPGEPVMFRARILDDVSPVQLNFTLVELWYYVDTDPSDNDYGTLNTVPMTFLEFVEEPDPPPDPIRGERCSSLGEWSLWEAEIPGQAGGDVVRFSFHCEDLDGAAAADPSLNHCPLGTGPCDLLNPVGGPGPGCEIFQECNALFRYTVGSSYSGDVSLNEVVPNNDSLLKDETDLDCLAANPNCKFDDFLELCNGSMVANEVLAGYVISNRPFRPYRGWEFRGGSDVLPQEHVIVWIDNDDKDPDPLAIPADPPNPNDPAAGEHHTDFRPDATSDEIYLLDTEANNFQVIDGVRWGVSRRYLHSNLVPLERASNRGILTPIGVDQSVARSPDCDGNAVWKLATTDLVTPGTENMLPMTELDEFRRADHDGSGLVDLTDPLNLLGFLFLGQTPPICCDASDADNSGVVDLSDALNTLEFLFLGSRAIPDPGPVDCGPDPAVEIGDGVFMGLPAQPAVTLGCDEYPRASPLGAACDP